MVLGNYVINDNLLSTGSFLDNQGPILLPMMIAGVGIIFSIIGTFFIRIKDNSALLSLIRMKNVPMIENMIPTPAIIIGNKIGP